MRYKFDFAYNHMCPSRKLTKLRRNACPTKVGVVEHTNPLISTN